MTFSQQEKIIFEKSSQYLAKAVEHLEWSLERTASINPATDDQQDLDLLEALTSRFARVSDILLRKVLRLIMKIGTDEYGSIIDIVNYAEKIGLIESAEEFDEIRTTRNIIAHDYAWQELPDLIARVRSDAPSLIRSAKKAIEYSA